MQIYLLSEQVEFLCLIQIHLLFHLYLLKIKKIIIMLLNRLPDRLHNNKLAPKSIQPSGHRRQKPMDNKIERKYCYNVKVHNLTDKNRK